MTSPSEGKPANPGFPELEPEIYSLQERPPNHSSAPLAEQLTAATIPPSPMRRPDPPPDARLRDSNFWALVGCNALVFSTSICIMVLELTASRLIAKHVGSSLYTWTSVIGVVLAGITIGNYLGGYLADRFTPSRTLAWLFFISSVGCFSVLWLDQLPNIIKRPTEFSWPAWVLIVVTIIFFWPAAALGTISPVVASMALKRSVRTGVTVGNVYAWGALGSIVGTFLTGFWLMDHFGTRYVIALTAGTLAVLGAIVATGQYAFRAAVLLGWLQFIGVIGVAATTTAATAGDWGLAVGEYLHGNRAQLPEGLRQRFLNELAGETDGLEPAQKREVLRYLAEAEPNLGPGVTDALGAWLAGGAALTEPHRKAVKTWLEGPARNTEALGWQSFASNLGGHFHQIGLLLKLRNDSAADYHDESNYSYINVSETTEEGDLVRYLRLDKLIHSYYNANNPTALYYDYEKVYAAVTELAIAERTNETVVRLDALPEQELRVIVAPETSMFEGLMPRRRGGARVEPSTSSIAIEGLEPAEEEAAIAELPESAVPDETPTDGDPASEASTRVAGHRPVQLPEGITWNPETKELRVRGGLSPRRMQQLLSQCRSLPWWNAVDALTARTRRADWGGFESVNLEEMPEGVVIPEVLQRTIRYDSLVKALTVYDRLAETDRQILLSIGPDGPFRRAVETLANRSRRVSTFFIGGGGFVFPRWIEARFPIEPRIDVAELDPAVKLAVQRQMGLARDGRTAVNTLIGDARNVVDDRLLENERLVGRGEPPILYDFVYGDAFNDFSVPWHLTTREFSEKVRAMLTEDGIYQVNLIDIYPRTMYPEGTVQNATVPYKGPMPERFGKIESAEWTRSAFPGLLIRKLAFNSYELRSPEAMSDELLTRLHEATDARSALNDSIHRLHRESRAARRLEGEIPAALRPKKAAKNWTSALAPYEALQMREVDVRQPGGTELVPGTHYVLAYRGAMPSEHRDALIAIEPGNQPFADAIRALYDLTNRGGPGRFLGCFVHTVAKVFPNVYVFSSDVGEPSDDRDTFVIACSMKPLPMERLHDHSDFWGGSHFAARETKPNGAKLPLGQFESITALARETELTDDYAPVENMLRPVFSRQR